MPIVRRAAACAALVVAGVLLAGVALGTMPTELSPARRILLALLGALVAGGAGGAAAGAWLRQQIAAPLARLAASVGGDAVPDDVGALAQRVDDLTEQLRAGDVQRARAEKLATVGRMAAGIAHEVGNPLAAINGYVHVLRGRTALLADTAPLLDALERESDRIDRIVRGLLDFARPRRITPASVDVNMVLADALTLLRDQGVLRRLGISTSFDPTAPAIFAERHELEQVFVNLLLNATDALDATGGTVALITRQVAVETLDRDTRRAGDAPDAFTPPRRNRRVMQWLSGAESAPTTVVQVVVADSGPGIPPQDWERVFDPFYTTKDPGRGTGLGLALVARTVEQLGGAVWVQRAREGGAAFVMLFPLAESESTLGMSPVADAGPQQLDLLIRR